MSGWKRLFRIAELAVMASVMALVIGVPMAATAPEGRQGIAWGVATGLPAVVIVISIVIARIADRHISPP